MIELYGNSLVFSFPEVHPRAVMQISFHKTVAVPDGSKAFPLPPDLGAFPLEHVDDYFNNLPEEWIERGGVMLPAHKEEAIWIDFTPQPFFGSSTVYRFAVKIAAGKLNAVTGDPWSDTLSPLNQDYIIVPDQPWLDGFKRKNGSIRQFLAMPMGQNYSAEAQLGNAEKTGGLQLSVYPMNRRAFEKRFAGNIMEKYILNEPPVLYADAKRPALGIAPGGKIEQEIYKDEYDFSEWETENGNRCFVHIADAELWRDITGKKEPKAPLSAKDYIEKGGRWFAYHAGSKKSLRGETPLDYLKSPSQLQVQGKSVEPNSIHPSCMKAIYNGERREP